MKIRKGHEGFTLVELIIVIVVIGILAAIILVAYNGITTQAKNTKTIAAVDSWIKGLRVYAAQKGSLPLDNSCLGTLTTYPGDGGYCWDGTSWDVSSSFLNKMKPYMDGQPEPDTSPVNTVNTQRRGAFYYGSHDPPYVYMMLIGVSKCPTISAGNAINTITPSSQPGIHCIYKLDE